MMYQLQENAILCKKYVPLTTFRIYLSTAFQLRFVEYNRSSTSHEHPRRPLTHSPSPNGACPALHRERHGQGRIVLAAHVHVRVHHRFRSIGTLEATGLNFERSVQQPALPNSRAHQVWPDPPAAPLVAPGSLTYRRSMSLFFRRPARDPTLPSVDHEPRVPPTVGDADVPVPGIDE